MIFYELENIIILYKNNTISKNELKNLIYKKRIYQKILFFFSINNI